MVSQANDATEIGVSVLRHSIERRTHENLQYPKEIEFVLLFCDKQNFQIKNDFIVPRKRRNRTRRD